MNPNISYGGRNLQKHILNRVKLFSRLRCLRFESRRGEIWSYFWYNIFTPSNIWEQQEENMMTTPLGHRKPRQYVDEDKIQDTSSSWSCRRISYTSVRRLISLSRITSWRSESSFALKMEFSLRKPSSHSFFDLQNIKRLDEVLLFIWSSCISIYIIGVTNKQECVSPCD